MPAKRRIPPLSFDSPADRTLRICAWLGGLFCLLLFGLRFASTLSFSEALQFQTSGDETASLFAVWKWTTGEDVYTDRHDIPFAAALFNWLFYASYGAFVAAVQGLLGLTDAWQPTLGRLFTAIGAAAIGTATYAAACKAGGNRVLSLAYAVLVAIGPLVGFWALTVRPDIWATALEIGAAAVFLHLYPRRTWAAVGCAAGLAYLAWSFKQSSVFAAGAIGFLLLVRREWWLLAAFAALLTAAWLLTFVLAGPAYRTAVMFSDYPLFFTAERALRNVVNFAIKSGPTVLPILMTSILLLRRPALIRALYRNDSTVLGFGGLLSGLVIALPLSGQTGASENYYFSMSAFLALLTVAILATVNKPGPELDRAWHPAVAISASVGWIAVALGVTSVLTGVAGATSLRKDHVAWNEFKICTDKLPRPLYVADRYMSLPWMTPGTTPFVRAYVYEIERAAGVAFEADGIGGLIRSGRFASIAVPGHQTLQELDGASFDAYVVDHHACPTMTVYRRRTPAE